MAERYLLGEIRPGSLAVCLITLAACWLGAPGARLPDEAIGFPTLLVEAGAGSVVAPLWPVPDEATEPFMVLFYLLLAKGNSPARALAEAQASMGDLDPSAWAAFFVAGA